MERQDPKLIEIADFITLSTYEDRKLCLAFPDISLHRGAIFELKVGEVFSQECFNRINAESAYHNELQNEWVQKVMRCVND